MALVSVLETILFSFICVLIKNLQADFPVNIVKYSEDIRQRNMILTTGHLITRQKANSKVVCGILCESEPFCKVFRFEAPSISCMMYREAIIGSCFGLPSPFVSYVYIHQGRATSWLMLYLSPYQNKMAIWSERNKTWQVTSMPDKMSSVCVDATDWRVYWAHLDGGIFSSDIKGKNKKALHLDTKSTSVALDWRNRRLFYDTDKGDYVAVYNLDTEQYRVFHRGDSQPHRISNVNVLPDLKLVFWVDNFKLWRKDYNGNEAQEIPGFFKTTVFLVDNLYNRLIWGFHASTDLFFSNAWGTDRENITLSDKIPPVPTMFSRDGYLYLIDQYSHRIRVFNCNGDIARNMTPPVKLERNENRYLLWIPEQVYNNL